MKDNDDIHDDKTNENNDDDYDGDDEIIPENTTRLRVFLDAIRS